MQCQPARKIKKSRDTTGRKENFIMEPKTYVTLLLLIFLAVAMLGGFCQGLLRKGQWVLGIVFAILAVPLVSPLIEGLLIKTKIAQMVLTDIPILSDITTKILKLLVFSISIVLIKRVVYFLTDFDLHGVARLADQTAGAVFTLFEVLIVIWAFELLMGLSANAGLFSGIHNVLMQSSLYAFIAKHNLLAIIFH